MATSYGYYKKEIGEYLKSRYKKDSSVLDVGAGEGIPHVRHVRLSADVAIWPGQLVHKAAKDLPAVANRLDALREVPRRQNVVLQMPRPTVALAAGEGLHAGRQIPDALDIEPYAWIKPLPPQLRHKEFVNVPLPLPAGMNHDSHKPPALW